VDKIITGIPFGNDYTLTGTVSIALEKAVTVREPVNPASLSTPKSQ